MALTAALLVVGAGTAAATPACGPFPDVPASNSHCADIAWFADTDVTNGYADGTFRPAAPVSRSTMAAFFFRLAHHGDQAPACTANPFPDVSAGSVLCGAIDWLATTGVTHGYADGTFRPAESVSRGEMAAFLYRFAGPDNKARGCAAPLFADVGRTDTFCGEIGWLVYHGIAHGLDGASEYDPARPLSRGTMATFLHRADRGGTLGPRPRAYSAFDAVFVRLVNHARTSRDLPRLRSASSVAAVAVYWSGHMADGGTGGKLAHNPDYFSMLREAEPAVTAGAENVARFTAGSYDPQQIMTAYMNSPGHRANILNPDYRYLGLRTVASPTTAFNTMNFVNRIG